MITARTEENMRVTTNFAQQGLLDFGEKKRKARIRQNFTQSMHKTRNDNQSHECTQK
jgi:hypothetical protein